MNWEWWVTEKSFFFCVVHPLMSVVSDMKDRMRMRKNMHQSVAWTREAPAEPPDGKAWRDRAGYMEVDEDDPILDYRVGRALRAFVGRKPFNRDH